MKKHIIALCLLSMLLLLSALTSTAQTSNWNARIQTHYFYDYDYDLRKQKQPAIKKPCSFLVEIGSNGTGKFVFLDDEYGDKFVYRIVRVEETEYSNGKPYIRLTTSMDSKQQKVFVDYKTSRKGRRGITKITLFRESSNDATVFTN